MLQDIVNSIENNLKSEDDYLSQASILINMGEYSLAIQNLSSAIKSEPENPLYYLFRGVAYNAIDSTERAIEDFDMAIELDERLPDAYYNRGIAFHEKGNLKKALDDYEEAVERNPLLIDAYYNSALVKQAMGDIYGAIGDYNLVIVLDFEDAEAYMNRAKLYLEINNNSTACEDLFSAASLGVLDAFDMIIEN